MTRKRVVKLAIIGSYNGLSPGRHQAIIWTYAGILLTGPSGTNFIEIVIGIQTFSFKKMHLKMSSAKWRPFCLGLNVLKMQVISSLFCTTFMGNGISYGQDDSDIIQFLQYNDLKYYSTISSVK